MGVQANRLLAVFTAGVLMTACSSRGPASGPPFAPQGAVRPGSAGSTVDTSASAHALASEAAARAVVETKLRAGYIFQAGGTVHGVDVAIGQPPVFRLGHGDVVEIRLVPNTEPRYLIHGARSSGRAVRAVPVACDGCVDGTNGTPSPQPTPPPNYGPCSSSGGATWYNNSTGEGGCTPRGSTKPLTCGTWSWSSRAKGTLIVPGTGTFPDLDYVVDNGDGSCRLGFV